MKAFLYWLMLCTQKQQAHRNDSKARNNRVHIHNNYNSQINPTERPQAGKYVSAIESQNGKHEITKVYKHSIKNINGQHFLIE